jgi:hypothetical protein
MNKASVFIGAITLAIALGLLVTGSEAQSPPIPGFTLLETITVPVNGSSAVSNIALASEVTYKLRASGTFIVGGPGDHLADAEYADFSNPPTSLQDRCGAPLPATDLGIGVNDPNLSATSKVPFWGDFAPDHVYTIDFVGQGALISLNYHDCSYDDNSGALMVEIFGPDDSADTCVPPPAGLVSWWPGDGNAQDIIGPNDGTLQGGATFAPGVVGEAFKLNGGINLLRCRRRTCCMIQ